VSKCFAYQLLTKQVLSLPATHPLSSCPMHSINVVLSGVLRGCGKQGVGFLVSLFSFWFIGTPTAAFLDLHQGLGLYGIWIALVRVEVCVCMRVCLCVCILWLSVLLLRSKSYTRAWLGGKAVCQSGSDRSVLKDLRTVQSGELARVSK
jgi:hypothetical protein